MLGALAPHKDTLLVTFVPRARLPAPIASWKWERYSHNLSFVSFNESFMIVQMRERQSGELEGSCRNIIIINEIHK